MAICTRPDGSTYPICDHADIDEENYMWLCFKEAPHKMIKYDKLEMEFCHKHAKEYEKLGWKYFQAL